MRIALAAHGRFHAFDYARELAAQGHTVGLFTNYPAAYVRRWGVPADAVRPFLLHGVVKRIVHAAGDRADRFFEAPLHNWFGRAAERHLSREPWDTVLCWSGVAEESLVSPRITGLRVCHRTSAHIRVQDRLLAEAGRRAQTVTERPSPWMIAREEREYAAADRILVPSTFALDTFLAEGFDPARLRMVPLGVDVQMFRPTPSIVDARIARILSGAPLRIGLVGAVSVRKGLIDVLEVAAALKSTMAFTWTGAVAADAKPLQARLADAQIVLPGSRPQGQLPDTYSDIDVFLFPSVEDGFGMVLSQAMASAIPVVASANSCAPDIVREGETGWVVPASQPDAVIERLRWCDGHRDALAAMCRTLYSGFHPLTWADSAARVAELCS